MGKKEILNKYKAQFQTLGFNREKDFLAHNRAVIKSQKQAFETTKAFIELGEERIAGHPDAINDRYDLKFLIGNEHQCDAIEVHGVRDVGDPTDPNGTAFEQDDENPDMYSVYLHCKEGGLLCVGDFQTRKMADAYAAELGLKYGYPTSHDDYVRAHEIEKTQVRVVLVAINAYAFIEARGEKMEVLLSAGKSAQRSLRESARELRIKASQELARAEIIERAAMKLDAQTKLSASLMEAA